MAAPVLGGDRAITVPEGGTAAVTTADLSATDADSTDSELVYTVTGAAHGTVLKSGSATTSFTQADLAANATVPARRRRARRQLHRVAHRRQRFAAERDRERHRQPACQRCAGDRRRLQAPPVRNGFLDYILDSDLFATDPDNTPAQLIYTVISTSHPQAHVMAYISRSRTEFARQGSHHDVSRARERPSSFSMMRAVWTAASRSR